MGSLSVAGVESKNVIKFNIINFVCCVGLEPLINKVVFLIIYPEFLVVEDTSESCIGNETAL